MSEIVINNLNTIEFHFFLNDHSHAMDAKILHNCNTEVLKVFTKISEVLAIQVEIETIGLGEGGLRQVWKVIGKNGVQITAILALFTLLFTAFPPPRTLNKLEKENLELQNEKLELEIAELKKVKEGEVISTESVQEISKEKYIVVPRSKFYETLENYNKVESIEYKMYDVNNKISYSTTIDHSTFIEFVNDKEDLPDESVDDAEIIIVAPVIIDKKYKWKGIYNDEVIDFYMNDNRFKDEIETGVVSFQSGAVIKCLLIIKKKLDETYSEKVISYAVKTVYSIVNESNNYVTISGKIKKKKDKNEKDQGKLVF